MSRHVVITCDYGNRFGYIGRGGLWRSGCEGFEGGARAVTDHFRRYRMDDGSYGHICPPCTAVRHEEKQAAAHA